MGEAASKPSGDGVRKAMAALGVTQAVLIGDTPDDMRAATAAGIVLNIHSFDLQRNCFMTGVVSDRFTCFQFATVSVGVEVPCTALSQTLIVIVGVVLSQE